MRPFRARSLTRARHFFGRRLRWAAHLEQQSQLPLLNWSKGRAELARFTLHGAHGMPTDVRSPRLWNAESRWG